MQLDEKRLLRNTRMEDIHNILSFTPREFCRNTRFVYHQDATLA